MSAVDPCCLRWFDDQAQAKQAAMTMAARQVLGPGATPALVVVMEAWCQSFSSP